MSLLQIHFSFLFCILFCSLCNSYIVFPASNVLVREIPGFNDIFKVSADFGSYIESSFNAKDNILTQLNIGFETNPIFKSFSKVIEESGVLSKLESLNLDLSPDVYIPFVGIVLISVFLKTLSNPRQDAKNNLSLTPYGTSYRYNATAAAEYFSSRQLIVFSRGIEVTKTTFTFGLSLLIDLLLGRITDPQIETKRADEVTDILTRLGPTYIKVGQSLSIRTDLLRPAYIKALTKLQDKVPAFPTNIARQTIREELGKSADEIFTMGMEPTAQVVAAASLGQVYKAKLRSDGSEVAVKIQRPNILEQVALDMHLLRILSYPIKAIAGLQSDLAGLIDDWGLGFVNELDYEMEAQNADIFMETIAKTPLRNTVFAPEVIKEFSTRKVLITRWVDGEKLDVSTSADVATLCSVAMNTYLTMMLECSILHCDPHPGNLKRTPDGRLCILDWGLVTSLKPDLQLQYIEHIAHITSKDYAKIAGDLVKLGFVPPGKETAVLEAGVVEVISDVYGQLAGGGGVTKVDVNAVVSQMKGLSETYGNLFQIPPYFAYIARAFGVLEGIGLSIDPNYAIVGECLPYIAQRLLTDQTDNTENALRTFVFGKDKDKEDRVIDTDRFEMLLQGFGSYEETILNLPNTNDDSASSDDTTTSSSSSSLAAARIEQVSTQILALLLEGRPSSSSSSSSTGETRSSPLTPFQKLILEELGKILGAGMRSTWGVARERSGRLPNGRTVLGTVLDPLGLFRESPLVQPDEIDKKILDSVSKLIEILGTYGGATGRDLRGISAADALKISQSISRKLWERRASLRAMASYLTYMVLRQTARRLEKPTSDERSSTSGSSSSTNTMSMNSAQSSRTGSASDDSAESVRLAKARMMLKSLENS